MKTASLSIAVFLSVLSSTASTAVFQYAVPVATDRGQKTAFLWLPPKAPHIRGVVIGGMTLMEREMAKDARIRAACTEEQLAIVFLKCGIGSVEIQRVLDDLAKASAYPCSEW